MNTIVNLKVSNEAFDKLTKAEQRVEIAKDVILRIESGQILPDSGTFLNIHSYSDRYKAWHESFKKIMETDPNLMCKTCAKGSLFMSYVARKNNHVHKDLEGSYVGNNCYSEGSVLKGLTEYFDPIELDLIELFFEGEFFYEWMNLKVKKFEQIAKEFVSQNIDDVERLLYIMNNIIKNNGEFIPLNIKFD